MIQKFLAYAAAVRRKTMERRGNLGRPFLMVYYEETKLINNWQLDRVLVLYSAEVPSVEKR